MKMLSKGFLAVFLLASALGLSACNQEGPAERAGQNGDQAVEQSEDIVNRATYQPGEMPESQSQEQIYGSQLMTNDERNDYQARMRAAKTAEEQELLRSQHHQSMQERAKARGMTLPDEPPVHGGGMGRGPAGGSMMQGDNDTP